MRLSIIAAMGKNREIGLENRLPWHLPDDLQMFQRLTEGHTVIMGKGTFESIGHPLKRRTNIVITSMGHLGDNPLVAHTLDGAIKLIPKGETEAFIIGGQRVFQEAIARVDRMYLTLVDGLFTTATSYFPAYDLKEWQLEISDTHARDEHHFYSYSVHVLNRKRTKETIYD